jgi:hypothetical protein
MVRSIAHAQPRCKSTIHGVPRVSRWRLGRRADGVALDVYTDRNGALPIPARRVQERGSCVRSLRPRLAPLSILYNLAAVLDCHDENAQTSSSH